MTARTQKNRPVDDGRSGMQQASDGRTRVLRFGVWRPLFALAVLCLAGYLLYRAAGQFSLDAFVVSLQSVTPQRIVLTGLFAAASYLCLTCFDALALRYVCRDVPYPYLALTSFTSLSLGHNIGFAALSSGAIRFRFYARYGLSAIDIARVIVFCGITVGLGLIGLACIALWSSPDVPSRILQIPTGTAMLLGMACAILPVGYILLCQVVRRPLRLHERQLQLPPAGLALGQVLIGTLNFGLVAACLQQAIGGAPEVPYLAVAAVYVLANLATLISHVPGGLGVIEGVVLTMLQGDAAVGGVILFRVAYFFVPLILGTIAFALSELLLSAPRARAQS